MPILKAAAKALRQAKRKTARNRKVKDHIIYLRRCIRQSLEGKDLKEAVNLAKQAIKAIDKAVQNKVLKKNTGSRIISRLQITLNKAAKK
jgi:small subunit ribosomal protein S20